MNWQERIAIDPKVAVGKAHVKGTRLTVDFVINLLAEGWSQDDVLDNYPNLAKEDIQACLAYAHEIIGAESVHPLKT